MFCTRVLNINVIILSFMYMYILFVFCFLGNLYSIKSDHSKSVLYFKKAVRMNPFHVTAWTLLGHEYIEMKNAFAAIISYRQALSMCKLHGLQL